MRQSPDSEGPLGENVTSDQDLHRTTRREGQAPTPEAETMSEYNYTIAAKDYRRMEEELRRLTGENERLGMEVEHLGEENQMLTDEVIELREEKKVLDALRAGGVDNWEWYDASLEEHLQD